MVRYDVTRNDVMCIPKEQTEVGSFTRPSLDFFVGGSGPRDYVEPGIGYMVPSLVPRPSIEGRGKEGLVHTVCACA